MPDTAYMDINLYVNAHVYNVAKVNIYIYIYIHIVSYLVGINAVINPTSIRIYTQLAHNARAR